MSSKNKNSGTTLKFDHEIAENDDRFLVVGANGEDGKEDRCTVTGVTYDGIGLTRIDEAVAGTSFFQCVSLWYLIAPPIGEHEVRITWAGKVDNRVGGAMTIFNAAQQAPEAQSSQALDSATTITTSVTTLTDGAWVIDAVGSGNKGNGFTPLQSGQVERYDRQASSSAGAGSTRTVDSAGLASMGWSQGANRLAQVVAAFAPASP